MMFVRRDQKPSVLIATTNMLFRTPLHICYSIFDSAKTARVLLTGGADQTVELDNSTSFTNFIASQPRFKVSHAIYHIRVELFSIDKLQGMRYPSRYISFKCIF